MALKYQGSIKTPTQYITQDISFSLDHQVLAIVGSSGSGKTMTALSLLGLLPPSVRFEGKIIYNQELWQPQHEVGKRIVYIPQNGYESLNALLTVKSQLKDQYVLNKKPYSEDTMCRVLEKVGFDQPRDILKKYSFELSGGMAQRVTLALACISQPDIIVCDEATNGLNERDSRAFIAFLRDNFKEAAKIVITHDLKIARQCDDILVLKEGQSIFYGTPEEIETCPQDYVKALMAAQPGGPLC